MKQDNKQTQELQQTQGLQQNLTPQQVLLVRLTEMPLEALQQRVENECLENPWLEKKQTEDDDMQTQEQAGSTDDTAFDYRSEDDIPDYLLHPTSSPSDKAENIEYADTFSFYDQLKEQMADFDLTEHEEELMEYLIGSLEDDGLLKKPLDIIADEVEVYNGIETSKEEMTRLLGVLQEFDPPGIGARTLQECLLLQIRREEGNPLSALMEALVTRCYDDFIHNRWNRIQERLKLSDVQLRNLRHEVTRLNPRPGSSLGESVQSGARQITPDFIVETDGYGNITMSLNQGNMPDLIVSEDATEKVEAYERAKEGTLSKSAMEDLRFTRQYVEKGQMFINAIAQRRESMTRTMQTIIRLQRPFFLDGNEALIKPMKLDDVAQRTGYDISTVSRVCRDKYVQTNFGTYPLKWFFTQKAVQKDDSDVSSRQAMAMLKEIIDGEGEDKINDERLAQIMKQKGYNIARRTVAKYREQMGIPVARMRK